MVMPKTVNGITTIKNIVPSDILFSHRPPWLKSIVKYDIPFRHRPPWLKSIVKYDILFSHNRLG
jgi:hypothetical protein